MKKSKKEAIDMKKELFNAFIGTFHEDRLSYSITKDNDKYVFYYSKGFINPNKYLEYDEEYYNKFVNEISEMTKTWKDKYIDIRVLDGTSWNLYINKKEYHGSNDYPENFDEVFDTIDKYFKDVKKSKNYEELL